MSQSKTQSTQTSQLASSTLTRVDTRSRLHMYGVHRSHRGNSTRPRETMKKIDIEYKAYTVKRIMKGMGFRVYYIPANSPTNTAEKPHSLKLNVGYSHNVYHSRPEIISAVVDKAFTSVDRSTPVPQNSTEDALYKWTLMNTAQAICMKRRRSAYTGTGILIAGREYPSVKLTSSPKK